MVTFHPNNSNPVIKSWLGVDIVKNFFGHIFECQTASIQFFVNGDAHNYF